MSEQATVVTGKNNISAFALISARGRIKLEAKGMRNSAGISTAAVIIERFTGEKIKRTTAKQRQRALDIIEKELEKLRK